MAGRAVREARVFGPFRHAPARMHTIGERERGCEVEKGRKRRSRGFASGRI